MTDFTFNTYFNEPKDYEAFELLKSNVVVFESAVKAILNIHQIAHAPLTLLDGTNIVFAHGADRVIKIFPPFHKSHYEHEVLLMQHLQNQLSVATPNIEYYGELSGWPYIIMSKIDGTLLEGLWETLTHDNKMILIREIGSLIKEVHALPVNGLESMDCHWPQFIDTQVKNCIAQHRETELTEKLLTQLPEYLKTVADFIPAFEKPVILTGEYTPMNLLVAQKDGVWHLAGMIDFGDAMLGLAQYDLLGPGVFLIQGDKMLLREFLHAYGLTEMSAQLSRELTALMVLHRYSNLRVQIRIPGWHERVSTFDELGELVWGL